MTTASPDRALATMALIEARAKQGSTHFDNFVPFAVEALRVASQDALSASEVALSVEKEFGLHVPAQAMEAVLKRAVKARYAVRKNNKYSLVHNSASPSGIKNLRVEQQNFLRQQRSLCEKFLAFCQDRHSTDLTIDIAERCLFDQIESNTTALLAAELSGAAFVHQNVVDSELSYLAADFVTHVMTSDQAAYEWLVAAAKGAMLSAALHLPNQLQSDRRFSNTTLYFDTPLLLKVVGLEGDEAQLSVNEVLRSARFYGAEIAAFSHNVREAEGIISAAVDARKRGDRVPRRSYGVTAYAIDMDLSASELEIRCAKFGDELTKLGIKTIDKPDPIVSIEIDENALVAQLYQRVRYRYEAALYRDADSLRGIHIVRRRYSSMYIETCRAVLITENEAVVRIGGSFFRSEGYEWPVATLISDLATLLYLKEPQKAPDLPKLQLAAGAYSALEPGVTVWTAWLEAIDQLEKTNSVTSDDIALLCHTKESRRILMQVTHGDSSKVEPATVQDVLREARRRVAAPYEEKIQKYETGTIQARAEAQVMAKAVEVAQSEADLLQQRIAQLERASAERDERDKRRRSAIETESKRFASRLVNRTLFALVATGTVLFLLSALGIIPNKIWLTVSGGVLGLGFFIGLLCGIFGGSVKAWLLPLEGKIAKRRFNRLIATAGLATEVIIAD